MPLQWRILLIHSGLPELRQIQHSLGATGCMVYVSSDATNLVRDAYHIQPHLVICEAPAAEQPSWRRLADVRRLGGMPLVVVGTRADEAERTTCLALGADEYIFRPFGIDMLVGKVSTLLSRNPLPHVTPIELPEPESNVLLFREPLRWLSPGQIDQIDELAYGIHGFGRIRLVKQGDRLTSVASYKGAKA